MVHEPRAPPRSRSRPGASDPSVKVTSYVRKGERALLVLANFGTTPARVRLGVVISGGGGGGGGNSRMSAVRANARQT